MRFLFLFLFGGVLKKSSVFEHWIKLGLLVCVLHSLLLRCPEVFLELCEHLKDIFVFVDPLVSAVILEVDTPGPETGTSGPDLLR